MFSGTCFHGVPSAKRDLAYQIGRGASSVQRSGGKDGKHGHGPAGETATAPPKDLKQAVDARVKDRWKYADTSIAFKISVRSLKRYYKNVKNNGVFSNRQVFNRPQDENLVEYIYTLNLSRKKYENLHCKQLT